MQSITSSSLAEVLPNLTKGITKVSRLYSPLNPLNPKPIVLKNRFFRQHRSVSKKEPNTIKTRNLKKKTKILHEFPSDDIKIVINTVEFTPKTEVPTSFDYLSAAEKSTINSSFDSNSRSSSKPSERRQENKSIEFNGAKKKSGKPARFLSPNEFQGSVRKNKHTNKIDNSNAVDLMIKIAENDKKSFYNELVYSKYRKHKYTKLLPIRFEDSWDWSSHGSVSPEHRVRFLDV